MILGSKTFDSKTCRATKNTKTVIPSGTDCSKASPMMGMAPNTGPIIGIARVIPATIPNSRAKRIPVRASPTHAATPAMKMRMI